MKNILLLSKEIIRPFDYLSCYGSKLYNTPNIDMLAKNGTLFKNFYTAAPSSAMSFTSMFTGLNPFETKRKYYKNVKKFTQCETMSDKLESKGYDVHVMFGSKWFKTSHKRSRVFSDKTIFHPLDGIHQQIGTHYTKGTKVKPNLDANPIEIIYKEVEKIFNKSNAPVFIWLHCPHVFAGRTGYGSDIDLFDNLLGKLFDFFNKDEIYLTADHGHMNMDKGISIYGTHVYEGNVRIPLITPKINNKDIIEEPVSNVQLINIIVDNILKSQKFVYSDNQYYLQRNRKLMIRKNEYKYIFNKRNKSEELYDLELDSNENVNLLQSSVFNFNREKNYFLEEVYYYPKWDLANSAYKELRDEKNRIWKNGKSYENFIFYLKEVKSKKFSNFYKFFVNLKIKNGRWGSSIKQLFYEK